jgi:hypothetical protein
MIVSARLECAEQRWSFRLELSDEVADERGPRNVALDIGPERFDLAGEQAGRTVTIALPSQALVPLRSGTRMSLGIAGGAQPVSASFSLSGSQRTIDAIAPRCSRRDMSAYRAVSPSGLATEATLARGLLAGEIRAFRAATSSEPAVAAALVVLPGGRNLLFATLCGSTRYYGNSGCNLTVHASQSDEEGWRRVYDTEGMAIYIDPRSTAPWPDLVTLTFDGDEITWRWETGQYLPAISDEMSEVGEDAGGE